MPTFLAWTILSVLCTAVGVRLLPICSIQGMTSNYCVDPTPLTEFVMLADGSSKTQLLIDRLVGIGQALSVSSSCRIDEPAVVSAGVKSVFVLMDQSSSMDFCVNTTLADETAFSEALRTAHRVLSDTKSTGEQQKEVSELLLAARQRVSDCGVEDERSRRRVIATALDSLEGSSIPWSVRRFDSCETLPVEIAKNAVGTSGKYQSALGKALLSLPEIMGEEFGRTPENSAVTVLVTDGADHCSANLCANAELVADQLPHASMLIVAPQHQQQRLQCVADAFQLQANGPVASGFINMDEYQQLGETIVNALQ